MKEPRRMRLKVEEGDRLTGSYSRSWPQRYGTHPNPVVHWAHVDKHLTKFELMWDTVGFWQDDFNPCYHEKYVGAVHLPKSIGYTDFNNEMHSLSLDCEWQLQDPVGDCRNINIPMGTWLEDFSARAENHFTVLVDDTHSIANFIIELVELFEGNIRILEKAKSLIERVLRSFRSMYKRTGNYWLSWNFAIKPTIRDIKAILSTLKRAEKRLKWLRERNHKVTKVKYREGPRTFTGTCDFSLAEVTIDSPYYSPPPVYIGVKPPYILQDWADWFVPFIVPEVSYEATVRLSAWAWVRIDIEDSLLDGLPGLGIVIAAMSGLFKPLDITWEAVPFSWLVDWFRTESHKLKESLKYDLNPLGHATILGTGWTSDLKLHGDVNALIGAHSSRPDRQTDPPRSAWSEQFAGSFIYRLYNRQPGLPTVGSFPFRLPISWYNASILTALAQQRWRRG